MSNAPLPAEGPAAPAPRWAKGVLVWAIAATFLLVGWMIWFFATDGEQDEGAAGLESEATATSAPPEATAAPEVVEDPKQYLLDQLAVLVVVDRFDDPPLAYDRDDFDWVDVDGDCQYTRHEVLIEEAVGDLGLSADSCKVIEGTWVDPFDGSEMRGATNATIDHLVALSHAHRAGAWRWSPATKVAFGNDLIEPATLNVASEKQNQAKANVGPEAAWRPNSPQRECDYAAGWVRVKVRWGLAATTAEVRALEDILGSCSEFAPELERAIIIADVTSELPTPTPVPEVPPTDGRSDEAPSLRLIGCDVRNEVVTIGNSSDEPVNLADWQLFDKKAAHTFTEFPTRPLAAGESVRVVTGEDAKPIGDDIFWKAENVWNNDGDTASLRSPDGTIVDVLPCR